MINETKMVAIGFQEHLPISSANSFQKYTVLVPKIGKHDLLVRVNGVSVNPVDTFVRGGGRKGMLKQPKIIGWDAVGIVEEIGAEVTLFNKGDRVYYAGEFNRQGSDAQYQAVDERIVGHAPKTLDDSDAAGIPLTALTAYESLFEQLPISLTDKTKNTDKTILIINGAGGVGSLAVQMAHHAGLKVIATASRPDTEAWVRKMGADEVVNHRNDLVKEVHGLGIKFVDYILNLKDLDGHWKEIAQLIKPQGYVAATTENHRGIDLQQLTKKMVTFAWEWMYSKAYYKTTNMVTQHEILEKVAQWLNNGTLQSTVTKKYDQITSHNLQQAHADVESGHMIGKVTLYGEWQ